MNLYIDCEWDNCTHRLISIALVPEDSRKSFWYEVFPLPREEECDPWVWLNVIPKLSRAPISRMEFRSSLETYLLQFKTVHIIADWPEDIAYFCEALITGPGDRLKTPPLTMEVLRIYSTSLNPHNALADAVALRRAVETTR